jgi:16S rRNA (adenine1518-N6/adenine1519-N6)-dimethyltransferase
MSNCAKRLNFAMAHHPRKRFGQHFLSDTWIVQSIIDAIAPEPGQALVEIGPGLGAMTTPLQQRCPQLTVIELDRDLAAKLRKRPGLEVIEADALKLDFIALAVRLCADTPNQKIRVVGNLPYNISTPILFHLLDAAAHIADQHFMLQKEVVERMVASPGSKDYGRLSVMLQWRYRMAHLFNVPPEAFTPAPRVDSAIIRMQPLPARSDIQPQILAKIVTTAFSQRRKILRATLGPLLETAGYTAPFDLQRRAEEVAVEEYLSVAQQLSRPTQTPPPP